MHFAHILYDAIIHILCPLNDLITNLKQNISNCFCWTWRPVDFCCSLTYLTWWLQGYKHCFSSYGVFINLHRNVKVDQRNMYEYRHLDQSFSNCITIIDKSINKSKLMVPVKLNSNILSQVILPYFRSHVTCVSETPGSWLSVLTHNILSSIMLSYFRNAHIYAHTDSPILILLRLKEKASKISVKIIVIIMRWWPSLHTKLWICTDATFERQR